jgi:hypothetical protein
MKKKWIVPSIVSLGCLALCYVLFTPSNQRKCARPQAHLCMDAPYFERMPVTLSSSRIPCIEVAIAGKTITAKIDLGSATNITLPSEFLKEIDQKSFTQSTVHYGIRGKKYAGNVYEIPEIKIGRLQLSHAKATEMNPEFEKDGVLFHDGKNHSVENLGRIGWTLFFNLNLFLDCGNFQIAFCDSLDTLEKQGYPVGSFVETPLLLDRKFIEFEAMTDKGLLRCVLDTGSTWNLLNKDLENQSNTHMIFNPDNIDQHAVLNPENSDQMVFDIEDVYDTPVFKIGKNNFGAMTFQKIKTPFETDAIIGMEFLESMLVFIDFPNKKIYFCKKDAIVSE